MKEAKLKSRPHKVWFQLHNILENYGDNRRISGCEGGAGGERGEGWVSRAQKLFRTVKVLCWRGKWPPTPLFLPAEFHGQRLQAVGSQKVRHDWVTDTTTLNTLYDTTIIHTSLYTVQTHGTHNTKSETTNSGWWERVGVGWTICNMYHSGEGC